MNNSYDELSTRLFLASQMFYVVGESYYGALRERPATVPLKSATEDYRIAGEELLAALSNCERHLLSQIESEEVKKELEAIRSRQHTVATIIKNLY
jgi:hypothetical protein